MREFTCIYHLFNQDVQKRKKGLSEHIKELYRDIKERLEKLFLE
jgi:hypothetical protein